MAFSSLQRDLSGALEPLKAVPPPLEMRVHRRYNPEGITAYNIVPGLLGTILTMTMVLMTGLAMTRERERGTFENLLDAGAADRGDDRQDRALHPDRADPGDAHHRLRAVALYGAHARQLPAVVRRRAGVHRRQPDARHHFSSIARNQLQAMQMTFFFFLPSILLSGFMFPFRGMPEWAQWLGSALPLTHFVVLVRGIMLKGSGLADLWPQIWPILVFMLVVIAIGLRFYKRTLD